MEELENMSKMEVFFFFFFEIYKFKKLLHQIRDSYCFPPTKKKKKVITIILDRNRLIIFLTNFANYFIKINQFESEE